MSANNRALQAFEHDVRVEQVVDFASMWNSLHDLLRVPDQLEALIDDSLDNTHLHPSLIDFMAALGVDPEESGSELLEKLVDIPPHFRSLIFMRGATPCRNYHGEKSWSSGWGRCYVGWVCAATFDAAWELLVQWADEMHAKDQAKGAAI